MRKVIQALNSKNTNNNITTGKENANRSGTINDSQSGKGTQNSNTSGNSLRDSNDEETTNQSVIDITGLSYQVPIDEIPQDIDIGDLKNEYACALYAGDVYEYLKQMELKYQLPQNFMQIQTHITPRLRAYCVDWQVEVHRQISQTFKRSLQIDTLFLSISLLDRFLGKKLIGNTEKLHLIGLGCFFIACKFEETYYPSIDQLLRLVPEAGKKDDVLRMEKIILSELRYSLGVPTSIIFLKRYAKAAHADSMIGMLSRFMSEYSLSSYNMISQYLPSQIAAAAISHALRIMGRNPWSATLQKYTGYSYDDIFQCVVDMKGIVKRAPLLKTQDRKSVV